MHVCTEDGGGGKESPHHERVSAPFDRATMCRVIAPMINLTVAANLNAEISCSCSESVEHFFFFPADFIKIKTNHCQQDAAWGGGGGTADAKKRPSNVLIGVWIRSKLEMFASSVFTTIMHSAFSLMDALVVCI